MKSAQLIALCKLETILQRWALIAACLAMILFPILWLFEVYPKMFMLKLLKAYFFHPSNLVICQFLLTSLLIYRTNSYVLKIFFLCKNIIRNNQIIAGLIVRQIQPWTPTFFTSKREITWAILSTSRDHIWQNTKSHYDPIFLHQNR